MKSKPDQADSKFGESQTAPLTALEFVRKSIEQEEEALLAELLGDGMPYEAAYQQARVICQSRRRRMALKNPATPPDIVRALLQELRARKWRDTNTALRLFKKIFSCNAIENFIITILAVLILGTASLSICALLMT